ncbi:YceI family protein [Streptomyces sp. NPDC007896]|uniref:YceI family protein n=1 Tax=Streptomyces sp. NPDC007896 TaxID=3364784 RepID=UPI0036EDED4F
MTAQIEVPGYLTGAWAIDPSHSDISFTIRHLGVSKVRGRFDSFEGEIVTAEDPLRSSVSVTIQAASIDTNNQMRDDAVRGGDFLDVEKYPTLTFRSTGLRAVDDGFEADGELTVHGVSRAVALRLEPNGFAEGWGGAKVAGFSATTEISRAEFGVTGGPMGATLGDKVTITLEIEATRKD